MTASKLLNIMCDKLNNAIGPKGRMIEHIRSKKDNRRFLKGDLHLYAIERSLVQCIYDILLNFIPPCTQHFYELCKLFIVMINRHTKK